MKAIGLGAGFLAFLAAALSAEAQVNIQGINPTSVLTTNQSALYTGQITGASGAFWKLCVTLNGQEMGGSLLAYVSGTAPITVSHSVLGMGSWNLQENQTINFVGKVGLSPVKLKSFWSMLVDDPSTYLPVPDSRTSPHGVRGELYAAIVNDEEELLA